MKKNIARGLLAFLTIFLSACSSDSPDFVDTETSSVEESATSLENEDGTITVPCEQSASDVMSIDDIKAKGLGGIRLNFTMSGITQVILESVDGYQIAGSKAKDEVNDKNVNGSDGEAKSIITLNVPTGETLTPSKDYYIVTFPCDLSGGYRLSIYKDGQVASYFGVHQVVEAGSFITTTDLVESELEFADPDAPFVEDERPNLNQATKDALVVYQQNPTEENKAALMEQMVIRYDKVVARKKAKLRELEREALHQDLVDEMQAIVDEMVENRDIRLEQQFYRLIDPRTDDNPNDEWLVLRGADANNPYIGYAPIRNSEYKAFNSEFTYPQGQENYPVVNVSYADAVAYCQWLSEQDNKHLYRLPTEEEWILAAGHMPKDVSMNSDYVEKGLTAVDAYAQTTGACGGIDFWGNCWEWTSTTNTIGEYIVKGGSWDSSRDACRSEYSDDARNGCNGYTNVGFRVVRIDR